VKCGDLTPWRPFFIRLPLIGPAGIEKPACGFSIFRSEGDPAQSVIRSVTGGFSIKLDEHGYSAGKMLLRSLFRTELTCLDTGTLVNSM
jgi:hypothetical protein